jgi:hypothetical protein
MESMLALVLSNTPAATELGRLSLADARQEPN